MDRVALWRNRKTGIYFLAGALESLREEADLIGPVTELYHTSVAPDKLAALEAENRRLRKGIVVAQAYSAMTYCEQHDDWRIRGHTFGCGDKEHGTAALAGALEAQMREAFVEGVRWRHGNTRGWNMMQEYAEHAALRRYSKMPAPGAGGEGGRT